jgi:hypothetical protein
MAAGMNANAGKSSGEMVSLRIDVSSRGTLAVK